MKILAVDTSSKICSVCILDDLNIILEKHTNDEKTHSQNLMPLISELFNETNLSLDDIDLLACSQGPGSFTGIRIGLSTIKAFADAKNISTVGVTSLESLAYNITTTGLIVSLIDAKNENVYFSLFNHEDNKYTQIGDYKADTIHNILSDLATYRSPLIFVGDAVPAYKNLIQEQISNAIFVSDEQNLQTSISIAKSAYYKYKDGIFGDSNTLLPIYLKKSQAERALDGEK